MITIEWSEEHDCYIGRNTKYSSAVIPAHDAGECLLQIIMISNKLDVAHEEYQETIAISNEELDDWFEDIEKKD